MTVLEEHLSPFRVCTRGVRIQGSYSYSVFSAGMYRVSFGFDLRRLFWESGIAGVFWGRAHAWEQGTRIPLLGRGGFSVDSAMAEELEHACESDSDGLESIFPPFNNRSLGGGCDCGAHLF